MISLKGRRWFAELSVVAALAVTALSGCEQLWGGFAVSNQDYCPEPGCEDGSVTDSERDGAAITQDLAFPPEMSGGDLGVTGPAVFVVGTKGTILRRSLGVWKTETSPTTLDLVRVHGANASRVFAVGKQGTIV